MERKEEKKGALIVLLWKTGQPIDSTGTGRSEKGPLTGGDIRRHRSTSSSSPPPPSWGSRRHQGGQARGGPRSTTPEARAESVPSIGGGHATPPPARLSWERAPRDTKPCRHQRAFHPVRRRAIETREAGRPPEEASSARAIPCPMIHLPPARSVEQRQRQRETQDGNEASGCRLTQHLQHSQHLCQDRQSAPMQASVGSISNMNASREDRTAQDSTGQDRTGQKVLEWNEVIREAR